MKPEIASGAIKLLVPTLLLNLSELSNIYDTPKSANFKWSSKSIKRLSGLISRWMTCAKLCTLKSKI